MKNITQWLGSVLRVLLIVPYISALVVAGAETAVLKKLAAPLWDFSKNALTPSLCTGKVEKVEGKVSLRDGAAFAIPAEAFPDQKNFTVQMTLSVNQLPGKAQFTFMSKQTAKDDGFDFSIRNIRDQPGNYYIYSSVNKILMETWLACGNKWPEINSPSTFTLAVRNGYATFYTGDRPIKSCLMAMIPNSEPMWVGRNVDPRAKVLPVTIHDVKVYGPDYKFVSQSEENSKHKTVGGKGWAISAPKTIEHPEWPKVLIYGDSISGGYGPGFEAILAKHNAYFFHFGGFVGGDVFEQGIIDAASSYKYDVIVFNNGLHSLSWTKEAVSDAVVIERMRKLTQSFKKGAPQAKIFYLSTTPYTTGSRDATPSPVTGLGDKNEVVVRLNTLSAQVMKEENIEWLDVYTILASKLELAAGDNFHWKKPAYEIISQEVAKRVLPVLRKDK
jgi:lysophospholipase L1-like esterase